MNYPTNFRLDDIIEFFILKKEENLIKIQNVSLEKSHTSQKYLTYVTIFLTFAIIVNAALSSFYNSTATFLSALKTEAFTIAEKNAFNNSNLQTQSYNLTNNINSIYLDTTTDYFTAMMGVLILIFIAMMTLLIISLYEDHKKYKVLSNLENEVILINKIIENLYSLKLKWQKEANKKDTKEKLFLFNLLPLNDYEINLKNILCPLEQKNQ